MDPILNQFVLDLIEVLNGQRLTNVTYVEVATQLTEMGYHK